MATREHLHQLVSSLPEQAIERRLAVGDAHLVTDPSTGQGATKVSPTSAIA